jgi:hypothetical protein
MLGPTGSYARITLPRTTRRGPRASSNAKRLLPNTRGINFFEALFTQRRAPIYRPRDGYAEENLLMLMRHFSVSAILEDR